MKRRFTEIVILAVFSLLIWAPQQALGQTGCGTMAWLYQGVFAPSSPVLESAGFCGVKGGDDSRNLVIFFRDAGCQVPVPLPGPDGIPDTADDVNIVRWTLQFRLKFGNIESLIIFLRDDQGTHGNPYQTNVIPLNETPPTCTVPGQEKLVLNIDGIEVRTQKGKRLVGRISVGTLELSN